MLTGLMKMSRFIKDLFTLKRFYYDTFLILNHNYFRPD